MAMAEQTLTDAASMAERLEQHAILLEEQQAEIASLKQALAAPSPPSVDHLRQPRSRRGILKLAGAGLAGVAGAALLNTKQALATQGSAVIAGQNNTETASTIIDASNATHTNIDAVKGIGGGRFSGVRGDSGSDGGYGVAAFGTGQGGGVYATGYVGVQASGLGGSFPALSSGTGVYSVGTGSGYGVYATGGGSAAPTTLTSYPAGVVAIGGALNNGFGTFGAPGLFAVGGPSTGQIQLAPASTSGPPPGDASQKGEVWADSNGTLWSCTASAVYDINGLVSPGVWEPLLQGGLNNALFTAVSTHQYTLASSNGLSWVDLDATNLKLTITPGFNCYAILTGNSDLWTSTAGFNQDLGISISGGAYPTVVGQPEAWKESGGFARPLCPPVGLL